MKFAQFLMKNGSVFGIPKEVERFSKFCPSPLSMKQFLDFGECSQPDAACWGGGGQPPSLQFERHLNKSRRLSVLTADFNVRDCSKDAQSVKLAGQIVIFL